MKIEIEINNKVLRELKLCAGFFVDDIHDEYSEIPNIKKEVDKKNIVDKLLKDPVAIRKILKNIIEYYIQDNDCLYENDDIHDYILNQCGINFDRLSKLQKTAIQNAREKEERNKISNVKKLLNKAGYKIVKK